MKVTMIVAPWSFMSTRKAQGSLPGPRVGRKLLISRIFMSAISTTVIEVVPLNQTKRSVSPV